MDTGGIANMALEDLLSLGDDLGWSPEDWTWDSKTFTAVPVQGSNERSAKRHCGLGSHDVQPKLIETTFERPESALDSVSGLTRVSAITEFAPGSTYTSTAGQMNEDFSGRTAPNQLNDPDKSSPTCQVESCQRDLAHLSTYHQRCRICEVHIKESVFMRAGIPQRFCQQCGRCHPLSAFQGQKRSCIDQLAKHNARRRRRQKQRAEASAASDTTISDTVRQTDTAEHAPFGAVDLLRPSLGELLSQSIGGLTSQAVSDQSHMEASCDQAGPATGQDSVAVPTTELPCDCGCVTQSVKPGLTAPSQALEACQRKPQSVMPAPRAVPAGPPMAIAKGQATAPAGPVLPPQPTADCPAPAGSACLLPETQQQYESLRVALALMAQPRSAVPQYKSQTLAMQLSIKLFHCTPADLPDNLNQQLTGWLNSAPAGAECLIRPGCVHLSVRVILTSQQAEEAKDKDSCTIASHLVATGSPIWTETAFWIQADQQIAHVENGAVHEVQRPIQPSTFELGDEDSIQLPDGGTTLQARNSPTAVCVSDSEEMTVRVNCSEATNVSWSACLGSRQLPCSYTTPSDSQGGLLKIRHSRATGPLRISMARQGLHLVSQTVLLCPDQGLVDELSSLQASDNMTGNHYITDLGLAMESILSPGHQSSLLNRLAEFACKRGLKTSLALLLSQFGAAVESEEAVWPLQHLCVICNQTDCLAQLLTCSELQLIPEAALGITPLHLAALMGSQETLSILRDHLPPDSWAESLTDDGLSPANISGHRPLLEGHMPVQRHLVAEYAMHGSELDSEIVHQNVSAQLVPDSSLNADRSTQESERRVPGSMPEDIEGLARSGLPLDHQGSVNTKNDLEGLSCSFPHVTTAYSQQGRSNACLGRSDACLGRTNVSLGRSLACLGRAH